jgi:hypothetical protein
MTSARQFLRSVIDEDFGSLGQVRSHLDQAEHNEGMARTHQGQAVAAKAQGERQISTLHQGAAEAHSALSTTHADLASAHLKNAQKAGGLHEGFGRGYKRAEDLVDFSAYDIRKSPASRGELDSPRPKHTTATVQDLRNTVNFVAASHGARVELVRSLGDNGFCCALILQPGAYPGTTQPSISSIEQEIVSALQKVAPAAICELLTSDEIPNASGPSARRLIFRLRLRDHDRGGF